jgi:NAD(P)-dependent dehydrogenase (short-subunit alcohol dehydrogenase family)
MKPLENRIALVTGASRGIGYAAALALAKAGAHIVATARTVGGLEELDDAIQAAGGTATLVPLDLRDTAGIANLAAALNERYGKLDILLGNAGTITPFSPLTHIEPKDWDSLIAVNLTANWHLLRYFEPLLKASDAARVVFVTSGAASNAGAYRALYSLTKAALDAMARSYAAETASTGLRVNLFSPGETRTRMHAANFPGVDPMSLPAPEEVAEAIVPLCLPGFTETGKLYDYRAGKLLSFHKPS